MAKNYNIKYRTKHFNTIVKINIKSNYFWKLNGSVCVDCWKPLLHGILRPFKSSNILGSTRPLHKSIFIAYKKLYCTINHNVLQLCIYSTLKAYLSHPIAPLPEWPGNCCWREEIEGIASVNPQLTIKVTEVHFFFHFHCILFHVMVLPSVPACFSLLRA